MEDTKHLVSPACAGVIPSKMEMYMTMISKPRMRGGDP